MRPYVGPEMSMRWPCPQGASSLVDVPSKVSYSFTLHRVFKRSRSSVMRQGREKSTGIASHTQGQH